MEMGISIKIRVQLAHFTASLFGRACEEAKEFQRCDLLLTGLTFQKPLGQAHILGVAPLTQEYSWTLVRNLHCPCLTPGKPSLVWVHQLCKG